MAQHKVEGPWRAPWQSKKYYIATIPICRQEWKRPMFPDEGILTHCKQNKIALVARPAADSSSKTQPYAWSCLPCQLVGRSLLRNWCYHVVSSWRNLRVWPETGRGRTLSGGTFSARCTVRSLTTWYVLSRPARGYPVWYLCKKSEDFH